MTIIMTKDGQVRPLQPSDLKEVAERDTRIRQLEQLNTTLAAQIDRMRPVVDAVRDDNDNDYKYRARLRRTIVLYDAAMAQLSREPPDSTAHLDNDECCHFQD